MNAITSMESDRLESKDAFLFRPFPKIPRFSREACISEKLDGTNASVFISEDGLTIRAGSRTRWITPEDDNHGFAKWVHEHRAELLTLGPGRHFGEWWGNGINRGYGLPKGEKRFSLFSVNRWCLFGHKREKISKEGHPEKFQDMLPLCVGLVPVLWRGNFDQIHEGITAVMNSLKAGGSYAAPGFMNPEGIVVFHAGANALFKKTIEKDDQPKSL